MKKLKILFFSFMLLFNINGNDDKINNTLAIVNTSLKNLTEFKRRYKAAKIIVKCRRIHEGKSYRYKQVKVFRGTKEQLAKIFDKDGFISYMKYPITEIEKDDRTKDVYMFFVNIEEKNSHPYQYTGIQNEELNLGLVDIDLKKLSDSREMEKQINKAERFLMLVKKFEESRDRKTSEPSNK